jgi:3-methyladenine DNA glycosylase AlkD
MGFIEQLTTQFEAHRNEANALPMHAYMKHLFPYLGIKAPLRITLLKGSVKAHKDELNTNTTAITKALYEKKEREYHYVAFEVYARFKKRHYKTRDLAFIEYLITTHSHWDSVDFIAKHILGPFLLEHPQLTAKTIERYATSENMWLNRSALLFQLGYKDQTDFKLLTQLCVAHKASHEFFIRKAIGWALREYAKIVMSRVVTFVNSTTLKPLSRKEALKHYKNN